MKRFIAGLLTGLVLGWWVKPKKKYPPFDKEEVRQAVMKTHRDAWDKAVKETDKRDKKETDKWDKAIKETDKSVELCPCFSIVAERVKPIQEQEEAHIYQASFRLPTENCEVAYLGDEVSLSQHGDLVVLHDINFDKVCDWWKKAREPLLADTQPIKVNPDYIEPDFL